LKIEKKIINKPIIKNKLPVFTGNIIYINIYLYNYLSLGLEIVKYILFLKTYKIKN